MKFDILKFFGGFAFWQGDKFGKLLFYAILISIGGFILWSAFIKPTKKEVQAIDQRLNLQNATIENITFDTGTKNQVTNKKLGIGIYTEYNIDAKETTIGLSYQF